jgi:hypothetical protein
MRIWEIALLGDLSLQLDEHTQAMFQKCDLLIALPLDLCQAVSHQFCSMTA